MQLKPTKLDKAQLLHVLKVILYVGASASIAHVIALIANDPNLFGPLTPIINIVLVALVKLFTPTE